MTSSASELSTARRARAGQVLTVGLLCDLRRQRDRADLREHRGDLDLPPVAHADVRGQFGDVLPQALLIVALLATAFLLTELYSRALDNSLSQTLKFHIESLVDRTLINRDPKSEAIRIGEEAGVPVQISHHKASGRRNWGRVRDSLALIDDARARPVYEDGFDIMSFSGTDAAAMLRT